MCLYAGPVSQPKIAPYNYLVYKFGHVDPEKPWLFHALNRSGFIYEAGVLQPKVELKLQRIEQTGYAMYYTYNIEEGYHAFNTYSENWVEPKSPKPPEGLVYALGEFKIPQGCEYYYDYCKPYILVASQITFKYAMKIWDKH